MNLGRAAALGASGGLRLSPAAPVNLYNRSLRGGPSIISAISVPNYGAVSVFLAGRLGYEESRTDQSHHQPQTEDAAKQNKLEVAAL